MIILGIETSCDDTSMAISENGKLLANVTMSSIDLQKKFGGIVPEIASRSHCELIFEVFNQCLKESNIQKEQLTNIVYTSTPGLIGSLHVGKVFALQLGSLLEIPVLGVNHMCGHVFSYFIDHHEEIVFPFISLVVSGGHTFIALFKSIDNYEILNNCSDDAAGEALDKIGRLLKLEYPGGVSIDNLYDNNKSDLLLINHSKPDNPFSFSGIKTHITNLINHKNMKKEIIDIVAIASSALEWITDEIIIKLKFYLSAYNIKYVVFGGGVIANMLLRQKINQLNNVNILLPSIKYTGDNAAMIATYGYYLLKRRNEKCN